MPKSFLALGIGIFVVGTLLLVNWWFAGPAPINYQSIANSTCWEWSHERSPLGKSILSFPPGYEVVTEKKDFFDVAIRIMSNQKQIHSWAGHIESVFLGSDDILYYADFSPIASGCRLVAVDLKAAKTIWNRELKGLGSVAHSQYRNQVALSFYDPATIRVISLEAGGGYVEFVSRATGQTLGHRIFRDHEIPARHRE